MVPESVRGCLREADARGSAFPRDLHSVTVVTLSFLRSRLTGTDFQEFANQGYLYVLDQLLVPEGSQVCLSTKSVKCPNNIGGAPPPLCPTPYAYAETQTRPLIYIHVQRPRSSLKVYAHSCKA